MSSLAAEPRAGGRYSRRSGLGRDAIARRVMELGREITAAYPDGELLVLGLLKGSFIFLSDLVRPIERPLQVDFLVASSYGTGTVSSGEVRLLYDPAAPLAGKHILLVEDIIDSGRTLAVPDGPVAVQGAPEPGDLRAAGQADRTPVAGDSGSWGFVAPTDVPGGLRTGSRGGFPASPVHRGTWLEWLERMPPTRPRAQLAESEQEPRAVAPRGPGGAGPLPDDEQPAEPHAGVHLHRRSSSSCGRAT